MNYGVKIECWGPYACFTRPEMKAERVSYDVMTPSAARGLVEAIYWHPGLRYVIDEIDVLNPIKFTNIRRNELMHKLSASSVKANAKKGKPIMIVTRQDIMQRASTVLKDVRYCITLHFEMTDKAAAGDNPGKFREMLTRRARKGQCYHQPYCGTREFAACYRLAEDEEVLIPYPYTQSLGYMLYDMDYSNPEQITPMFFKAELKDGILDLRNCEVHQ